METLQNDKLSKIKNFIFYALIFLMPVFVWQWGGIGAYPAKIALLATGLVLLLVLFFISMLSGGLIVVPKSKLYLVIGALVLGVLVSALFSGAIVQSVAGAIFEVGTAGSIFILCGFLVAASVVIRKIEVAKTALYVFLATQTLSAFYLLLRSFFLHFWPDTALKLSFIPAGGMINLSMLLGAAIVIALYFLNAGNVSKRVAAVLWFIIVAGVLIMGASNFLPALVLLGLFALAYFIYMVSLSVNSPVKKISFPALFVLAACIVFVVSGNTLSGKLSSLLQVSSLEIRPSLQTTLNLVGQSWGENLFLGVGPNRFAEFWSKAKPAEVNLSQFWAAEFSSGYGFVPTLAVTTGLIGLIPLLFFIAAYVYKGFKNTFLSSEVFLSSIYLWLLSFVYTPDLSVLFIAFVFSGMFISIMALQGKESSLSVNIFSNPKTNFISVLSIVILLILSVVGGYFVWERVVATQNFNQGLALADRGDFDQGRAKVAQAINLAGEDVYWRSLSEISLLKFSSLLQAGMASGQLSENAKNEIQNVIAESIESSRQAINLNPDYYLNWISLAKAYEVFTINGVAGAAPNAKAAYSEALVRSPGNPAIHLAIGRIEAISGDTEAARVEINKALELKRNYTDAYFTLAQIEAAANNIVGATQSVESATAVDPGNAGLFFQLGLLKYNQKNFAGAAGAFERAVTLVPDYANAKYFLGLSYHYLDRGGEAIKQFEDIEKTNSDNQEIKLILSNLKAGKEPFADAEPPVENPAKRSEPPIPEE